MTRATIVDTMNRVRLVETSVAVLSLAPVAPPLMDMTVAMLGEYRFF